MGSIDIVREEVNRLYTTANTERADLSDWLYKNHVYQVAEAAKGVAERFGGNPDLAYAAGLLHDVADAVIPRLDPTHAARSEEIAREILTKAGFATEEIALVIDDALRFHSCHDTVPQTPEGKALSTGDAISHLTTDFYAYLFEIKKAYSKEEVHAWLLEKIDRDFRKKIAYDEVREEVRAAYEQLKQRFTV